MMHVQITWHYHSTFWSCGVSESVLWVNRGSGEVLMSHPCSREARRVSSSPAAPLSPPARSELRSAAPAPPVEFRWPPRCSSGAGDPSRGRRVAASHRASRGRSRDSRRRRCGAGRPRAPEPRGTRCSPRTARAGTRSGAAGRGSGVSRGCHTWPRPAGSSRTFSSRAESFTLTELHLTGALAGARLFCPALTSRRDNPPELIYDTRTGASDGPAPSTIFIFGDATL